MGKKGTGDGLFKSSRMMASERRQPLLRRREEQRKRRPALDDQALEQFALLLLESMEQHTEVAVSAFDPYENDEIICGTVGKIDFTLGRVKLSSATQTVSILFADIVGVARTGAS
jgi:class 3 adenylate cyclase